MQIPYAFMPVILNYMIV